MFYYTALITLGSVLFYGWLGFRVAKARAEFKIAAPATTGHPTFERLYRVQMNTLEWLPIYLPSLWLFAHFVSDAGAALLGLVWIAGRVIYARAYVEDPKSRGLGFTIQLCACVALGLGAIGDILLRLAIGD